MGKKKKKQTRNKLNLSLSLSIIAIVVSLVQLFFENPIFVDYYNRTEIEIVKPKIFKYEDRNEIVTMYNIINEYKTPAENVKYLLTLLPHDKVQIPPSGYIPLEKDSTSVALTKLHYDFGRLAPGELHTILVISDFEEYLEYNEIDTLQFDKRIAMPDTYVAPRLNRLKYDDGFILQEPADSLELLEMTKQGRGFLIGPVR